MRTTPPEKIQRYVAEGWWSDETLDTLARAAAETAPDRVAVVDPPDREALAFGPPLRLDHAALARATDALAARLHAAGLREGDRVIVQLPNIVELVATYLAAARLGLVLSPIPMQYGTHELAHVDGSIGAAAYLSLDAFKGAPFASRQRAALGEGTRVLLFGMSGEEALSLEPPGAEAVADYRAALAERSVDANDIFTICWTSGTTGQPKGVPRSHNHWRATTMASEDAVPLDEGAVLLNPFPLVNMASIGGFLYFWLRLKGTLVLHHPFDAAVFLGQLDRERVVYTVAAPALLSRLLQMPDQLAAFDLSSLRWIGSGSAPVAARLVSEYRERLGIELVNLFGSNEGMCLVSAPGDVPEPAHRAAYFPRFGAAGLEWQNRAGRFLATRLVDLDSGEEIDAPGRPGELRISGPSVFDGYHDAPEANARVFDEAGDFRTGDVFEIAEEGAGRYLRFVGRAKDIIVRGGMKISPEELDTLLEGMPGVTEAAVCGVPDEEMEERVGVVLVPSEAEGPSLADVAAWLETKGVARFKWPERLARVEALPRNPLNKVLRSELPGCFPPESEG